MQGLVAKAYRVGEKVSWDCEVIIIENGSSIDTLKILLQLEKKYPKLRVIRFLTPLGYGGALREGFARATRDWVFYTDGDGQYDPLELTKLVRICTDRVDVVNGYKTKRADRWYRAVMGNAYNWFLQKRYHPPIRDVDCDFRLIRRSLLSHIVLETSSALACLELVLKLQKAGARFAEVGVSHYPRVYGRSEFFRMRHMRDTIRDHWNFTFPT